MRGGFLMEMEESKLSNLLRVVEVETKQIQKCEDQMKVGLEV